MFRLSKFLITLPILSLPLSTAAVKPALASGIAAEQAVQILSRAQVADSRCKFLSSSLHEELSRYAARAEIAAASQISTGAASSAVSAGEAEGRSAPCNAATRADVNETLSAARDAVKAADSGHRTRRVVQQEQAPEDQDTILPKGPTGDLGAYAKAVKAYYAERKCRHLSGNQDLRYWKAIVRLHRAVVAENGAAAVAPVMGQAKRSANSLDCGGTSLTMVKAGFAETVRR